MLRASPGSNFFFHEFHRLIGHIYNAVTGDKGFIPFLEEFVSVFDAHSACLAIFDERESRLLGAWSTNIPDHALAFYSEHVAHRDVLVDTARRVFHEGRGRFVASNLDLGPEVETLRTETRAGEWLDSFGVTEAAGAIAFSDGQHVTFFGLQRNAAQPAFTRSELSVFDHFLVHLSRAVGLHIQLQETRGQASPERLALNHINRGILICDTSFRVVFRNDAAGALLKQDCGMRIGSDGMLNLQNDEAARRLSAKLSSAITASLRQEEQDDQIIQLNHQCHQLVLVISPLSGAAPEGQQMAGAMIRIHNRDTQQVINPYLLRAMFGLTDAETEVATQLLEGQTLSDIATLSGRSRETVKYHLNSLFRKTGTSRQGELISLLSRSCVLS